MILRNLALAALLAHALSAQTPSPDELYQTGLESLRGAQFRVAEAAFRTLAAAEPDNIRGLHGVAVTLFAQGKPEEAVDIVQNASDKAPGRADLLVLQGDLLLRSGRPATALLRFQKALTVMDMRAASDLQVRRGNPAGPYPRGNPAGMLNWSFAVLAGPDTTPRGVAGVYVRIAEIRAGQRDFDEATAALRKARLAQPNDPVVLSNLGLIYETRRMIPDAIEAYRTALAAAPDSGLVLNNLAFMLADSGGDLDEALRDAKRAVELLPKAVEIQDTLGWVALKKGLHEDAVLILAQLVAVQPRNAGFRRHLLAALDQAGDKIPNSDALRTAVRRDPFSEGDDATRALVAMLRALPTPRALDQIR